MPRTKPARRVSILLPISADGCGIIRLAVGNTIDEYFVSRVAEGVYELVKRSAPTPGIDDRYTVDLSNSDRPTCDCKGGTYHGHCKHADALRVLKAMGKA